MSGSQSGGVVSTTLTVDDGEFRRSLEAAARLINGHVRAVEQASRVTTGFGEQAERAAGGTRNFSNVLGQAGFQIQDFAGQVGAGTSALTALSQQGSQFLGVFGPAGAAAGALLTVGILSSQFLGLEDATSKAAKAQEDLRKKIEEASEVTETAAERTTRLANARLEDARAAAQQASGEIINQINQANRYANQIQQEIELLRRTGNPIDAGIILQNEQALSQANGRFAALQRRLDEVEGRLAGIPPNLTPTVEVTGSRGGRGGGGGRNTVDTVLRDAEALQSAFDRVFDGAENRAEERISRFADETSRASRNVDELASLGRDFATVFTSAFDGLTTQGGKLSDVLDRLGLGLARILERQFITKPLESAVTSSLGQGGFLRGIFDSAGSALSGLLGFRADGGPVSAGSPYIVGERGPELFVPNFSGTIVPNHAMGGGAVFNIDARGAEPGVEARIRAVLAQEAPKLSAYVRGDLAARVNRGGHEALTFGRRRT